MIVLVFEEARVVPRAAGRELGDFVPSHFEDQLQGLLHVLFKERERGWVRGGARGVACTAPRPPGGARRGGGGSPGGHGHAAGAPGAPVE